jgi:hypothetical protein
MTLRFVEIVEEGIAPQRLCHKARRHPEVLARPLRQASLEGRRCPAGILGGASGHPSRRRLRRLLRMTLRFVEIVEEGIAPQRLCHKARRHPEALAPPMSGAPRRATAPPRRAPRCKRPSKDDAEIVETTAVMVRSGAKPRDRKSDAGVSNHAGRRPRLLPWRPERLGHSAGACAGWMRCSRSASRCRSRSRKPSASSSLTVAST